MIDFFFGFIIQNDSLAIIVIAVKYEYSKGKWNNIQIQYQLKFDMPQAGYSCIKYDITEVKFLTETKKSEFSDNLVDAPSREWSVGCCQENVKLSDQI